jgi:glycosyltransferase involved in cell wall biosynthesis
MTVLFFILPPFTPNEGGVQRSTAKLSSVFRKRGYRCLIVSLSHEKDDDWEGIPIIALKAINSKTSKAEFKALLNNYSVDVIINQMGSELDITRFIAEAKNDSTRLVNTLRMNPLSFVQNSEFIIRDKLKRKNLSFIYSEFLNKAIVFYHRKKQKRVLNYILEKVDYYITLSPSFIPELEFFGIDAKNYGKKILAIPNMFPKIEENTEEKTNVILYVGRLGLAQKRIDLLQKIWLKLHQSLPNWDFWVVGDGEAKVGFQEFCLRNDLNRVSFYGFDDPSSYYAKAKIFTFTSAYEGFGNVLIEAQQHKVVPVMFNSYSAAPDLVKDGVTGKLIEPFNVDEYVTEVLELTQNTELLEKYAQEARIHAREFEYEAISKKWFDLLD